MKTRDAMPEDAPAACAVIRLAHIVDALPAEFETLRKEARAEGYNFVERLAAGWAAGETRFDRPGEAVLAAYIGAELAAIGGLTIDPVIPEALRMRRFYVRERYRRSGIGRRLVAALLDRAVQTGRPVMVNAGPGSGPFWEALGFVSDARDGHTHMLKRD
jgi:GNAT superfamily N-acetyltransferase